MAKIMFIGDPHLKITNFQLALKFLAWVNQLVTEVRPDAVVNLGDMYDNHAVLRSEIMTESIAHVDYVLSLKIPYAYLLGNHDMFKPTNDKYHALKHMKGKVPGFFVVDEQIDWFGMTLVPHKPNPADFPTRTLPICVAHQTFKGADYGDITTKDGVHQESIEGAELIISGHIHKRQKLESSERGRSSVLYVGSPFAQSASDINQVKGITVLDTDTYKETFYECPLPKWRGDKFTIEAGFTTQDMHEYIVNNLAGSKDHWRLDIVGPKAEIMSYLSSTEYKRTIEGIDVKIKTSFTDREKRQVRIESLSVDSIIAQYVAKVYSGSLDKTLLTEKALEILRATK